MSGKVYAWEDCGFEGCVSCFGAHRHQAHGKSDGKPCSNTVANPVLPSPNSVQPRDLMASRWHKTEQNKSEQNKSKPPAEKPQTTIDVAQWKCVDLGLASPRWARPSEALCAFDAALQNEHRANPQGPLTTIADELGELWLEYTRSRKGSGEYAMGPAKFFGEAWYRRAAAWRDAQREPSGSVDGSDFIAAKRKKRAAAENPSPLMNADDGDQQSSAGV